MLPAQDHKRALDGDRGPNTGGMGAYCPCPLLPPAQLDWVEKQVLQQTVDGLRQEGCPFVGKLLYSKQKNVGCGEMETSTNYVTSFWSPMSFSKPSYLLFKLRKC